jgi:hypothetical protein
MWGGSAVLLTRFGLVDGGVDRVAETGGLWLARGRMCVAIGPERRPTRFTACAWGNYWNARVARPGDTRNVDAIAAGLGFGFGELAHEPKKQP